jgi:hypothetical protein
VCPFGRTQRENVKYIYVHILVGKRDSIPRADECKWVKIIHTGGFGLSNSEGLVYITRHIFHLIPKYNTTIWKQVPNCNITFTPLTEKHPTSNTKDNKIREFIHYQTARTKKREYNSRNVIFASEPPVPRKSRILFSLQSNTYYRLTHNQIYNNQTK